MVEQECQRGTNYIKLGIKWPNFYADSATGYVTLDKALVLVQEIEPQFLNVLNQRIQQTISEIPFSINTFIPKSKH